MKRYAMVMAAVAMLGTLAVVGCTKKEEGRGGSLSGGAAEGKQAVDFTLKDLQGKDVRLADLSGKVVMLNFWATWCPPCRAEIPSMVKLNEQMAGKPFQMLCVSIDDGGKEDVEAFFKREGVQLPALTDPGSTVGKQYGITGVPETFIIDKKGKVVKKVIGGLDWGAPDVVTFLTDLTNQQ